MADMEILFEQVPWLKFFWLGVMVVLGACLGSFLNVLIYRLPNGIGLLSPSRSFCPTCEKQIPWVFNIPVLSWLLLRGRSQCCRQPISSRYLWVEVITALGFLLIWSLLPLTQASFISLFFIIALTISWIDAETMLIPLALIWFGMFTGLVAATFAPHLIDGYVGIDGLWQSLLGGLTGAGILWLVSRGGKLAFGVKAIEFDSPTPWRLEEPKEAGEEISLLIGDGKRDDKGAGEGEERIQWSDMFYRKRDRLIINGDELTVNGKRLEAESIEITQDFLQAGGKTWDLEKDLQSASGKAIQMKIPREAMGAGDIWLLAMLGCWTGWQGVVFSLFASSILALVWALFNRIGMGKQLPYGPFLCGGGFIYLLWGSQILEAYLNWVL